MESNPHLRLFRPALRPHQLPLQVGVHAGNRTLVWRSTVSRSATELRAPCSLEAPRTTWDDRLARARGIEPRSADLESDVVPLDHTLPCRPAGDAVRGVEEGGGIEPHALRHDLFSRQSRRASPVHPPRARAGTSSAWWARVESNHRPSGCKPGALPAELPARLTPPARGRWSGRRGRSEWWGRQDSNLRSHTATGLQPIPFAARVTPPSELSKLSKTSPGPGQVSAWTPPCRAVLEPKKKARDGFPGPLPLKVVGTRDRHGSRILRCSPSVMTNTDGPPTRAVQWGSACRE